MDDKTTIGTTDLRRGDLLFFARPSTIQRFSGYVGDDYRGVAVVDRIGGKTVIIQCGRERGFEIRPLDPIIRLFDTIAVGSAPDCHCINDVMDRAHRQLDSSNRYPTAALVPAFFLSGARQPSNRLRSVAMRAAVIPLAVLFGLGLELWRGGRSANMCSTFAASCYQLSCAAHQLHFAPTKPKPDQANLPAGVRGRSWIDRLLVRWYLTPSDLWRSLPSERRHRLATQSSIDDERQAIA